MIIDMSPGPDGVFRMNKPGTGLARVASPTAIAGHTTRTAGAAASGGLKGLLTKAVGWAARLSTPGKLLLGAAALFGISKAVSNDAPQASQLAMGHPVMF